MSAYNRVVVMGNLTRDPELKKTGGGTAVADLGMAMTERYKSASGEPVETTCFVDVVTWGRQAEVCCEHLKKGACVLIEGRLQLDQWQGSDGQKRSKLRVRADRVHFVGGRRATNGNGGREASVAVAAANGDDPMPF